MAGPLYKAMINSTFQIKMTPRGEIVDVVIPDSLVEAIKSIPGAAAMGDMFSAEGFERMMMQGAMTLPEENPEPGDSWSTKTEFSNPVFGKQIVEMSYEFQETREVDGQSLAVFKPTMTMSFEGGAEMQAKIKEQQSSGEVVFNTSAGRLDSTMIKMSMMMELNVSGQTINQPFEQSVEMKLTPVEESGDAK
jgi:hypothetical protein